MNGPIDKTQHFEEDRGVSYRTLTKLFEVLETRKQKFNEVNLTPVSLLTTRADPATIPSIITTYHLPPTAYLSEPRRRKRLFSVSVNA
jgi:hypothetical protein